MEHQFPRLRFFSEDKTGKLIFFFYHLDNGMEISVEFFNNFIVKRIHIEKNRNIDIVFKNLYAEMKKINLENLYGENDQNKGDVRNGKIV
jgi:hypothetical protein